VELLSNPIDVHKNSLDPTLINGKLYSFTLPPKVEGHQYLWSNEFATGSITLKEQVYENQLLRYDIYNQLLTLKFTNQFGSEKIIVVSDAWLSNFTMGNKTFALVTMNDGKKRICQTIGRGDARVLYVWKKQLKLDGTSGQNQYRFSKPLREKYLQINGINYSYRWNKSFARSFGENHSSEILKYIRHHKIKVNKASDSEMETLMDFCNSIIVK
jgi:hypothetical protein